MKFTGSELITHKEILFGYARKRVRNDDDALDIVQTTYMKAIRYNDSFYNREHTNMGGWLMSILKNLLKDYYEKLGHMPMNDTPYEDLHELEVPPHIDEYKEGVIFKDSEIDAAFAKLTDYQKQVIYNTYILDIDDFTQSDALKLNRRTLISRRKKGMDSLRRLIKEARRESKAI